MDIITPGQLADELESGKWNKGRLYMASATDSDGACRYCCLGVAGRMIGFSDGDLRGLSLPQSHTDLWSSYSSRMPWLRSAMPGRTDGATRVNELAWLNDDAYDDWAPVVARLREIDAEIAS